VAVEEYSPFVGGGNAVDDSDEGGLAGTIGAQKSVDAASWNLQRHIIKRGVARKLLGDIFDFQKSFHEFFDV
jgi:hypothetical protein